ncbi:MAG TPA: S9 family peptidase [Allosphingosinicella sp.]
MNRILKCAVAAALGVAAIARAAAQPVPPQRAPDSQSAPRQPAASPIPLETFAELPFFDSPVLSPDGTHVAARILVGEEQRIGIWRIAAGEPVEQLRNFAAPGVASYQWAGNDRLLVNVTMVVVVTASVTLPIAVRRVASYEIATGEARPLEAGRGLASDVIFTDPDGRYVLLSTPPAAFSPPAVYRVDLASGAATMVQPNRRGVLSWFADSDGVVRVGVDYGERRTKIYYRAAPGAELRLVDTQRNVQDDSVVDMVRFVGNTERGIIVTNAETGRFAVYRYDFATDTRGEVLFEHPEVDVTTPILNPDGSVDGVAYEDDRPRLRWLNPQLAEVQRSIDRTFPGKTNIIASRSRDGNRMLVFSSAADDPGTYYVYDRAARRMEIFGSPLEGQHEIRFAPVRPVSYRSRDGLTINGYLTLPPGRRERGLPLIVMPHGGPFLRDSWRFDQDVQFLASRGYAVLQPNFRGSTGYGKDFVAAGYGQLGAGMIDDMDDGVEWLVGQGIADASRVCIMGASYGGYAAVWAAMRSPQRYRCAVSFAGPSDLRSMLSYDSNGYVPRRYVRAHRQHIQGEERIDLDAISPLRQAARLTVPLLIGHGDNDVTVPADQSRRLVNALTRRRAANLESVFYPKAAHGFTVPEERIDWLRRVEAFLARHNPAAERPAAQ